MKFQPRLKNIVIRPIILALLLVGIAACGQQTAAPFPGPADAATIVPGSTSTAAAIAAPATAAPAPSPEPTIVQETTRPETMNNLIPKPTSVEQGDSTYTLNSDFAIYVDPPSAELNAIGEQLAQQLRTATGYDVPVQSSAERAGSGGLLLTTTAAESSLGAEGYELEVAPDGVTVRAPEAAGVFYGVQTLRQLFPPAIEAKDQQTAAWTLPTGTIRDTPRFAWRGVMLDVSRHFFGVDDVKRYIDLASSYKLNRLHLHLSDDQGWRIEIKSWPELTRFGSQTEVGGGEGGFYTQEQYADIVAYAAVRYMTVVPEIDTPGHTNAALASYPELNCDGVAPQPYSGIEVGFSSLCIGKGLTYEFLDDVIGELAALTPGAYIHIGGDEALSTELPDYIHFVEQMQAIVESHGKQMIGWEEIGRVKLSGNSVAQYWANAEHTVEAARQGAKIIMSPAKRVYLDMKYDEASPLGLSWAGLVSVEDSYSWDPATAVEGLSESDVLGVEGPLWSETLEVMDDIEFMAFPRLLGLAETGWSAADGRDWDEYRLRLAAHGLYLDAREVNFYRTPEVPWP